MLHDVSYPTYDTSPFTLVLSLDMYITTRISLPQPPSPQKRTHYCPFSQRSLLIAIHNGVSERIISIVCIQEAQAKNQRVVLTCYVTILCDVTQNTEK